jgi:four helix bundle protein
MNLKNFRCFSMAKRLYQECLGLELPSHLRSQMDRAASSIALNLAEGLGRSTHKDQRHFFTMALGSTKEVQAILALCPATPPGLEDLADHLGGSLYRLCKTPPL